MPRRDKAPLQRIADRISGVFVPAVLIGAVVTFFAWWLVVGDIGQAVLSGLAVLLVACPCAMGLAAPVAMMVGLWPGRRPRHLHPQRGRSRAAGQGRPGGVRQDRHPHRAPRRGRPCRCGARYSDEDVLSLAAAVEAENRSSDRPRHSGRPPDRISAADVRSIPGVGVTGTVGDHEIKVSRLVPSRLPESIADGVTSVTSMARPWWWSSRDGDIVGAIAVDNPSATRGAPGRDHLLALGLPSAILSGDSDPAVRTVAAELGIDIGAERPVPRRQGRRPGGHAQGCRQLLMVGDGINDAPALAAADVGCAIGSGSEAALANSDVALLGNDLEGVPAAIGVAGSTYSVILQNFGWAMGYNVSALPLAAFGLLDPLVAAVAMGLSSVLVVLNSLRLSRLGRSGLSGIHVPRFMQGRRGIAVSVLLPVVLFATLTVISAGCLPPVARPSFPSCLRSRASRCRMAARWRCISIRER